MGQLQLSAKDERICAFIAAFSQAHGYAPSIRDIAQEMGSPSTTPPHYHLRKLRAAGYVQWEPNKVRTLVLTEKGKKRP